MALTAPSHRGDGRGMDDEQAALLRRAVVRLARCFNRSATGELLTPTQASVLGIVVVRGPLSVTEIAKVENLNSTMASRAVGALDRYGLVTRIPNARDLRVITLETTPSGREVHARISERRGTAIQRAVDQLSPDLRARLIAALPALEVIAPLMEADAAIRVPSNTA
jgi:DNA-binding MarR family transcriptional regulator